MYTAIHKPVASPRFRRALDKSDPARPSYQRRIRAQRRMTASLAISSLLTFALVCVPYGINALLLTYDDAFGGVKAVKRLLWMVSNMNPTLNIAIYVVRHWEVRRALRALAKCQQLPENVNAWGVQPAVSVRNISVTNG